MTMTCSCDAWPRCSQPSDEGPGGLCAECRAVGHDPVLCREDEDRLETLHAMWDEDEPRTCRP